MNRCAAPTPVRRPTPAARGRRLAASLAIAACAAWSSAAWAFEQRLELPAMVVSVPQLPQVALSPAPGPVTSSAPAGGQARAWVGQGGAMAVDVHAVPADAAGSTRLCAGVFLRDLVRRPGMPARDSIYRAPLDVDNFLVLYLLEEGGARTVHAHLLAAVHGAYCVDAHFSRPVAAGEDIDEWRQRFAGAAIKALAR